MNNINKILLIVGLVALVLIGVGFVKWGLQLTEKPSQKTITSFEECADAGYPVMESHPRQCKTPDGKVFVEEIEPEESNREKAENWIEENAPTYLFDGSNLKFMEERGLDLVGCEDCYEYEFEFTSRHAGYGNREGEAVAQVITPHTIVVTIENGEITKVVTDNKFDEMKGELIR